MRNNNEKSRNKKLNVGIELLRFILCLWIVIIHCSNIKSKHWKYLKRGFHVPTFILISFYFYYPILQKREKIKITMRFQRLLFPYILWPIIIFILNNLFSIRAVSIGGPRKLSVYDIYIQILTGTNYHTIFWFQFNLIFLSLCMTIISFILKKNFLIAFELLGILSLYLHFSGINYKLFISFNIRYKMSLGSLIELFPIAIIGSIYSSINLLLKIKNIRLHFYLILFSLIHIFFKYDLFMNFNGCIYPNVLLNLVSSSILFILFGSFNDDKFKIIEYFSKFTGGIYYIHPIIRNCLGKYFLFIRKKSYFSSYFIYIINYIFCYIGSKIFKNNILKYLFI